MCLGAACVTLDCMEGEQEPEERSHGWRLFFILSGIAALLFVLFGLFIAGNHWPQRNIDATEVSMELIVEEFGKRSYADSYARYRRDHTSAGVVTWGVSAKELLKAKGQDLSQFETPNTYPFIFVTDLAYSEDGELERVTLMAYGDNMPGYHAFLWYYYERGKTPRFEIDQHGDCANEPWMQELKPEPIPPTSNAP